MHNNLRLQQLQHEILLLESEATSLKNRRDKVLAEVRKKREEAVTLHNQLTTSNGQQELKME